MKVTSFEIYRYGLPLKSPVLIRGRSQMRLREGIILSLTLDNQWQGFGEIALLKGFESGEIEECLNNLKELLRLNPAGIAGRIKRIVSGDRFISVYSRGPLWRGNSVL